MVAVEAVEVAVAAVAARHLRLLQQFVVLHHAIDLHLELGRSRGERRDELRHLCELLDVFGLLAEL